MTLDEAIKHAKEVAEKYERHLKIYENMGDGLFREEKNECKDCADEHRQLAGWLKELKELREQEPCEDCVSREALYKALYEHFHEEDVPNNITEVRLGAVRNFVKNFPIVVPAPKKCHNLNTDYAECDQFVCSNCGIELQDWHSVERDEDNGDITYHDYLFHYCPNCGAKIGGKE